MKFHYSHFQIKYDFKWLALAEPEGDPLPIIQKSGEKVEEKFQGTSIERKHLPILNVSFLFENNFLVLCVSFCN